MLYQLNKEKTKGAFTSNLILSVHHIVITKKSVSEVRITRFIVLNQLLRASNIISFQHFNILSPRTMKE